MAVVADGALHFGHRFVLDLVPAQLGLDVGMATEAELTRLALDEFGLIGPVRAVTGEAVAVGKRRMGGLLCLAGGQLLVTGQAEFSLRRRDLEQARLVAAMGSVAARAFPPDKGPVGTEQPLFRPGLAMAGETEIGLPLRQQLSPVGLVRRMAVKTASFLGRKVRVLGVGKNLPVMTGEAEIRRVALEQGAARPRMAVVTGQALAFADGSMHAPHSLLFLPLLMTVQADLGRRLGQHAGMVAGMDGVTHLAVARLDRIVLRRGRDVVMTGLAEPAGNGLHGDGGALDLMAVVALAAFQRLVNHFLEQSRLGRTVLRVAVDAIGCDRVILMGGTEAGLVRRMT